MKITESLLRFICEHADDDPERLLLSAKRYEGVDVPFAARQILIRKRIRDKLPSWHANPSIIFPGRTASEQCSSEQTARYKQRLLESEKHLCDLTGGLGIDTYFFSQCVEQISYVELSEMYFETAMYNFSVLQAGNINGYQGDAVNMIKQFDSADVFFIDPARRGEGNTRVFALSDCDPDLCIILPELLKRAPKVIAKLSPMLDIRHTLKLLPQTAAVHVVSVRNECKELLFVLTPEVHAEPRIHCVNYMTGGTEQSFSFQLSEEHTCRQIIADSIDLYLYEPDASVLKAGAYKQTALQKGVKKLHVSSHLYTSDQIVDDFPGRIFRVATVFPFNGKWCKTIARYIPKAHLAVRNFPMSVQELRKRTHIVDGGEVYLFATTLSNNQKVIIQCGKLI